jgi:hypothetical protein
MENNTKTSMALQNINPTREVSVADFMKFHEEGLVRLEKHCALYETRTQ